MFSSDLRLGLDRMPVSLRRIFGSKRDRSSFFWLQCAKFLPTPQVPRLNRQEPGRVGLTVALPRWKRWQDIDFFSWPVAPLVDLGSYPPPMRIRHGLRDVAAIVVAVFSEVFIV